MMNQVIETMLNQIGGNKFFVMTGCNHVVYDNKNNEVKMSIPKNSGKVNTLRLKYDAAADLYNMEFYKYTPGKLNTKTWAWTEDKVTNEKHFTGVFADQLAKIFESVTGMYTRLF